MNPSWKTAIRVLGVDKMVGPHPGLGPRRKVILEMGHKRIHDFMGFSCFSFLIPAAFCFVMVYRGHVGENSRTYLALAISACLVYTSIASFAGDYWFSGANEPGKLDVPEWQIHTVFNKIDT